MKITTKTGDKGKTSLFGGKRVSKSHDLIELLGLLDELQAFCAFAKVRIESKEMEGVLARVIDDLYRMMAVVGFEMKVPKNIVPIGDDDVRFLEDYIEKGQSEVQDLNRFIRPGTVEAAAKLNLARCACRKVERAFVRYFEDAGVKQEEYKMSMVKYLNRLSDLLFIFGYGLEERNLL